MRARSGPDSPSSNPAAAVNVVLYDRRLKRHRAGLEPLGPVREMLREYRWPVGRPG
jgi:hypothetical protein